MCVLVTLQLDSLQNPCADIGLEVPSMLRYQYQPDKEVSSIPSHHAFYYFVTKSEKNKIGVKTT